MKKFFVTTIFLAIFAVSTVCLASSGGSMRLGILPVFKAAAVSADLTLDDTEICYGSNLRGYDELRGF